MTYVTRYIDGKIKSKTTIINNDRSIYEEWNDRGVKIKESNATLIDGQWRLDGKFKLWYDNGNPYLEYNYRILNNVVGGCRESVRDGWYYSYKYSEQLLESCYYINNKPYGIQKYYDFSGRLAWYRNWKDGLLHGECRKYSEMEDIVSWYWKDQLTTKEQFENNMDIIVNTLYEYLPIKDLVILVMHYDVF